MIELKAEIKQMEKSDMKERFDDILASIASENEYIYTY